jgi:hypothetical protein
MSAEALYYLCMVLAGIPAIAIAVILAHYCLRRAAWKRAKRLGKTKLGFFPSAAGLGMMFLFMQALIQPSLSHVLEAKQEERQDEDAGDAESPAAKLRHFHRQLRRIRHGERVDRLEWRM